MSPCSHGGIIAPDASIHYTYDALDSQHSVTVCSGWITDGSPLTRPTTPPPADRRPPGLQCEPVPPGGTMRSIPTRPGPDDAVYLIRVDFHDRTDSGQLVVFEGDRKIARGILEGCGVAIWTFDVNR